MAAWNAKEEEQRLIKQNPTKQKKSRKLKYIYLFNNLFRYI